LAQLIESLDNTVSSYFIAHPHEERTVPLLLKILLNTAQKLALSNDVKQFPSNNSSSNSDVDAIAARAMILTLPPAKFNYEELENSSYFFIPYVWKSIVQQENLPFFTDNIELWDVSNDNEGNTIQRSKRQLAQDVVLAGEEAVSMENF
jgi:hypothetical protein